MAKIALISDIHGNLPALEAVLEKLGQYKPDEWICLGDVVGYGPHPKECINMIRERNIPCLLGNHDAGVSGLVSVNHFRDPNRRLIKITQNLLSEGEMDWLKNLPYKISHNSSWVAAHSSPIEPEKWNYVDSAFKARDILDNIEQDICFIGHTHIPSLVSEKIGTFNFIKGLKYLINPGSVGQSRDSDYRASCCIVDIEKWKVDFYRVEYNSDKVISELVKLGFTRSESHHLMRY
ncbi:metallophosphoesterase family protein [Gelidibacter japonicus]|uniref:metallophosphoesterase family protein n=1 Tax=Gelidibacter japonicus TaxID=1962232 RepID=UPI003A949129